MKPRRAAAFWRRKGMNPTNKPEKIILHHSLTPDSGTVSWVAIRRFHMEELGWSDIGYHYGIESVYGSYEILMGRLLDVQGAHTYGHNRNSIGICFVGNFDFAPPCENQWQKGLQLVNYLRRLHDIPVTSVWGHRDFTTKKSCPGEHFDIEKFRRDLWEY